MSVSEVASPEWCCEPISGRPELRYFSFETCTLELLILSERCRRDSSSVGRARATHRRFLPVTSTIGAGARLYVYWTEHSNICARHECRAVIRGYSHCFIWIRSISEVFRCCLHVSSVRDLQWSLRTTFRSWLIFLCRSSQFDLRV